MASEFRIGSEGVAQDVLFELLALDTGMPPDDALALLVQPSDVRAAVPGEEGCDVLAKRMVLRRGVRIAATCKEVLEVLLGVSPILTTCGVSDKFVAIDQARLSIEPIVPVIAASDQVVGTSHGVFFGAGLSQSCRTVIITGAPTESAAEGKYKTGNVLNAGNAGLEPTTSSSGG
jgi:hypothetical protein